MHCALEKVPGLGFLQTCCGGDQDAPVGKCGDDPCGEVESGFCKLEDDSWVRPVLGLELVAIVCLPVVAVEPVMASPLSPAGTAPPEITGHWHCWLHTAHAPRAPSFTA